MMAAAEETRRKGLGRGLSALLGDDEAPAVEMETVEPASRPTKTVPIEFIAANPIIRLKTNFSLKRKALTNLLFCMISRCNKLISCNAVTDKVNLG